MMDFISPARSFPTANARELVVEAPSRGVSLPILLTQIKNTSPYIFNPQALGRRALSAELRYLAVLRSCEHRLSRLGEWEMSHEAYFELCVCAHWATVGSFVPTDVDNQIRFKLWHPTLSLETIEKMGALVEESYHWDARPVSTRVVLSHEYPSGLSGHHGEWFSVAAGLYGALRKRLPNRAMQLADALLAERLKEERAFLHAVEQQDGIKALRLAALIAHNLGDLERVLAMWNLSDEDYLRVNAVRSTKASLALGNLNTTFMANENHRHFALRGPKCLRRVPELLLPLGPFFDDWGKGLASHPLISLEEVAEVAEALVDGWERLRKNRETAGPFGYARALAGILEVFPGGASALERNLPARIAKSIRSGELRKLCAVPQHRFEEQWNHMALKAVKQWL